MPASRTAEYVALYRALETTAPGRAHLFEDRLAVRLLPLRLAFLVRATARSRRARTALERYADRRAPGARTSAIARTALLDDFVRGAIARGLSQLVILGAGFDCRAHRLPELARVRVFEVDRQETQAEKQRRLAAPSPVRYVPVDFLRDDVGRALAGAGWDPATPTCFVWEGVTNYLTEPAVAQVLAWIGTAAPGSTVAFTYVHRGVLAGDRAFPDGPQIVANVRALGEPWTFGLLPEDVAGFVERAGLVLREDVGADAYRRRYLGAASPGYAFYRIAVADVTPADR